MTPKLTENEKPVELTHDRAFVTRALAQKVTSDDGFWYYTKSLYKILPEYLKLDDEIIEIALMNHPYVLSEIAQEKIPLDRVIRLLLCGDLTEYFDMVAFLSLVNETYWYNSRVKELVTRHGQNTKWQYIQGEDELLVFFKAVCIVAEYTGAWDELHAIYISTDYESDIDMWGVDKLSFQPTTKFNLWTQDELIQLT